MKRELRKAAINILRSALSPIYSGIGSILCLHRVVEPTSQPRISGNAALEISPASLEQLIVYLMEQRIRIVSLDEVYDFLKSGKHTERFLAFTFDDGYLDNYTLAYPIFKKYKAPFAVNVTTSFVGNSDRIWWYRLEEIILKRDRATFSDRQGRRELETTSKEQKETGVETLSQIIRKLGAAEREDFLLRFFESNRVERDTSRLIMTWEEIKKLATDELVTISAHSVNHYDPNRLTDAEVLYELDESRRIIESQIGQKVEHFAYPFGGRNAVGRREFALAKSCGFKTATTTRGANLFPAHAAHLECLPRIVVSGNYPTLSRFKLIHSGTLAAVQHRFKRVVTD